MKLRIRQVLISWVIRYRMEQPAIAGIAAAFIHSANQFSSSLMEQQPSFLSRIHSTSSNFIHYSFWSLIHGCLLISVSLISLIQLQFVNNLLFISGHHSIWIKLNSAWIQSIKLNVFSLNWMELMIEFAVWLQNWMARNQKLNFNKRNYETEFNAVNSFDLNQMN